MPIDTNEIMNLLSTLARDERLSVTVTQGVRGGVIAGFTTLAGALVAGPIGMAVGGAAGGLFAAATSRDFKSVPEVLATMQPADRERLAQKVEQIMGNVGVSDVIIFAGMLTSGTALRNEILAALTGYLREELQLAIAKH